MRPPRKNFIVIVVLCPFVSHHLGPHSSVCFADGAQHRAWRPGTGGYWVESSVRYVNGSVSRSTIRSKLSMRVQPPSRRRGLQLRFRLSDGETECKRLFVWTFETRLGRTARTISLRSATKQCRSCRFCDRSDSGSFERLELGAKVFLRRGGSE